MKTVKTSNGDIVRLSNEKAKQVVNAKQGSYCWKAEYKKQQKS